MTDRRGYRILEPDGSCHEYTTATHGLAPLGDRLHEEVEPVRVRDLRYMDRVYLWPTARHWVTVHATWHTLQMLTDREIRNTDHGTLTVYDSIESRQYEGKQPNPRHTLMISGDHYVYRRLT